MNTAAVSFEYKGIAEGKYTEGIIEALDKDEASFKLREKKVIITSMNVVKGQKISKAKKGSQKARSVATATPTFLIVNTSGVQEKIVGAQPYTVFERVIESLL